MLLDPVETLRELVSLPSVNPMGRPLAGPEFLEYRVTEYLEGVFRRLELPWVRQTVEPRRDNIVARLDGTIPVAAGGPLILWEAHQDTVPVDGMTIEPWNPIVRDGRVYGRGACDIKGGLAAMLSALARLATERPAPRPTILFAATVNEEHGFSGAARLARLWDEQPEFCPRRPDLAIVAEPTELDVVVAHKGAVRWRVHTRGRSAHSSQADQGDNAVYKMARVLLALERYQREVTPTLGEHPLCGRVTLSVGTITGGISVNTVPERCTIEIDRRLLPGQDGRTAFGQVVDYLRTQPEIDFPVEHDEPYLLGSTLSDGANRAGAERLATAARAFAPACRLVGVPYGTNASALSAAGLASVVFGPGSIAQAHTADEWLAIDQLERACQVLYRFATTGW